MDKSRADFLTPVVQVIPRIGVRRELAILAVLARFCLGSRAIGEGGSGPLPATDLACVRVLLRAMPALGVTRTIKNRKKKKKKKKNGFVGQESWLTELAAAVTAAERQGGGGRELSPKVNRTSQ